MITYFLLALVCAIAVFGLLYKKNSKGCALVGAILTGFVTYGCCWLVLPNVGLHFGDLLGCLLPAYLIYSLLAFYEWVGADGDAEGDADADADGDRVFARWVVSLVAVIAILVVAFFSTAEWFHYKEYRQQLKITEVPDSLYRQDFVPIDPNEMIKVDLPLAAKYGSAVLEQNVAIGSVCELNAFYRIYLRNNLDVTLATGERKVLNVAGQVFYLAPLEHRSFLKWKSRRTTPGYLLISAQRQNEVYFVTAVNGQELKLRYLNSAYFADDLWRHLRRNGYMNGIYMNGVQGFDAVLDPSGRPYAVATKYHRIIGWAGEVLDGVVTVDMQTGAISEYDTDNMPEWIDRVYPQRLVEEYIQDWGEYPNNYGYWNSVFAQNEVREATPGMTAIYNNGERYFYTGIKSAGADDGTSGIMMINSRTGEAKIYSIQGGANEASTRDKFETYKIDAAELHASDVIIYPVKNELLYFATLTGNTGEFLGYGVASVKYREIAAVGKTIDEALMNYYQAKHQSNQDRHLIGEAENMTESLRVKDIVCENGIYYLLMVEKAGQEFMAPASLSGELRWTKPGHSVKISYATDNSGEKSVMLDGFENLTFEL